jgi:hypothetical protein
MMGMSWAAMMGAALGSRASSGETSQQGYVAVEINRAIEIGEDFVEEQAQVRGA